VSRFSKPRESYEKVNAINGKYKAIGANVNAPYLQHHKYRTESTRERRYPMLALIDLLLGWSIGLASLAVGIYALGRVITFFFPVTHYWLHAIGL
jgi:hypothetical protein